MNRFMKNILGRKQSAFQWEKLRLFSMSRWPKELGVTHGVGHWDRVAKFGRMLYRKGADLVANPQYDEFYTKCVENI